MIPVCISTWSKAAEGIRTRVRAAALGCMSGMVFVFAYIFVHPYIIDSISGLDAVAAFEVACVAIVSAWVTLRLLRKDESPYFIGTVRGINIDRGLLRAYVAFGIPLIVWSMYEFHAAEKAVLYTRKSLSTYSDIVNSKFDENFVPDESERKKNEILGDLRREFITDDVKDADEFHNFLEKQDNEARDDLTASIYRLLVILFPLVFYPVLGNCSPRHRQAAVCSGFPASVRRTASSAPMARYRRGPRGNSPRL
jgi:hypothetical protein